MRRRRAPRVEHAATGATAQPPGAPPRGRQSVVPPPRRRLRRGTRARRRLAAVVLAGLAGAGGTVIWGGVTPNGEMSGGQGSAPDQPEAQAAPPASTEAIVVAEREPQPVAAATAPVPPPPMGRRLAAAGWSEGIDRATVAAIQQHLAALGFRPGRTDGTVDAQTRRAIERFQDFAGLPATGAPSVALQQELAAVRAVGRD